MRKRRGAALAVVLTVLNVAFLAACVVAFNSIYTLNTATSSLVRQQAVNLADSAASSVISALFYDSNFGVPSSGSPMNASLALSPSATAVVDFDPTQAALDQVPWSTNNLNSTQAATGWNGRTVPPNAADVWALGSNGRTLRMVEVLVVLPSFPYSIASSGTIVSSGGLYVEAVASSQDVGPNGQVLPSKTLPGSILSDSPANGNPLSAITLRAPSTISGDANAVGSVSLGGAIVDGQVVSPANAVALTPLNVTNFDPQSLGILDYTSISSPYSGATISNYAKCNGPLDVQGKLDLNGGILYVNGDLTLEQGVVGEGALVVNGQTKILSGSTLAASNQAVLLSASDVLLSGHGRDADFFTGFVYSGGNFKAQAITLVGSFVSYSATQNTSMSLDNVHAIQAPDMNTLTVYTKTGYSYTAGAPLWPAQGGTSKNVSFNATWGPSGPPPTPPADPTAWFNGGACFNGTTFNVQDPFSGAWTNGLNYAGFIAQLKVIQTEYNVSQGHQPNANNLLWPDATTFPWLGDTLYSGHVPPSELIASHGGKSHTPPADKAWRQGCILGTVAAGGASVSGGGSSSTGSTQNKVQITFSLDNFIDISQAARVAMWRYL